MESLTLTLSKNHSILDAYYYPPIELSPNKNYVLGLVELLTFNSIPNIDSKNNKIYIENQEITIPIGSYEIGDIEKYLQNQNINITIQPNNNTLRCEIKCDRDINFKPKNSIGQMLGFEPRVLIANTLHISDSPVAILNINTLRVECNITSGSYINNQKGHCIHEFYPQNPPGFRVIETPSPIIYLPVVVRAIDHLQLRIVDQNGDLVNFRGETITIRLHIKSL